MLEVDPEQLQRTAADACRRLPGAVALYAFGSLAGGSPDRFSDVDLELVTVDLASTLQYRQAMYADIGVPMLEWRIHPSRSDWAATVLFRHISPYQRLDLGFSRWTPNFAANVPSPSVLLWQQRAQEQSTLIFKDAGYSPKVASFEHYVVEMYLSAIRYAKTRKRGQHLTSYRFASALASSVLSLMHAGQHRDPAKLRQKLSTQDYLQMDCLVPEEMVFGFLRNFDFSSLKQMDQSVGALLQQTRRLFTETLGNNEIPSELFNQLETFVMAELGLQV